MAHYLKGKTTAGLESAAEKQSDRNSVFPIVFLSIATLALHARGLSNTFVTDDESEVLKDPASSA